MQGCYQIKPSSTQLLLLLIFSTTSVAILFFHLEPSLFKYAALVLIVLLTAIESRCLIRQQLIKLRVDTGNDSIEFRIGEQTYFYRKYKVYQTRWFAILKVIDNSESRTLILNSDRFESTRNYHQLRFLLRKLEQRSVT